MRKLLCSPWQTLSIPFALTTIGQLHQSEIWILKKQTTNFFGYELIFLGTDWKGACYRGVTYTHATRLEQGFYLAFYLSSVAKAQLHYWTKRVLCAHWTSYDPRNCHGPRRAVLWYWFSGVYAIIGSDWKGFVLSSLGQWYIRTQQVLKRPISRVVLYWLIWSGVLYYWVDFEGVCTTNTLVSQCVRARQDLKRLIQVSRVVL